MCQQLRLCNTQGFHDTSKQQGLVTKDTSTMKRKNIVLKEQQYGMDTKERHCAVMQINGHAFGKAAHKH